ncbi:MAG TPA: sigma-70 family RNA polymerase sigma factor [Planctomycetaceae bacterium]|nr:sigma-70 family RNA polymerase sigma factor [Planctomycetaceae bacterium]
MDGPLDNFDLVLQSASAGDISAMAHLLTGERGALNQFVATRLDKRLAARLDVGDIVQDVLIEAACKLPDYLDRRPLPFTAWLQCLALERLAHVHRTHIRTKKRSVCREVAQSGAGEDSSNGSLVSRVMSRDKTPSSYVAGKELYEQVAQLMKGLPECDQELLRLRFIEQHPVKAIATSLGLTQEAVRMRQLPALRRLRELLDDGEETR